MPDWEKVKKKLFVKPDAKEYLILFLMLMLLILAFGYKRDIQGCKEIVEYYVEVCFEPPPYDLDLDGYLRENNITQTDIYERTNIT